MAQLCIAVTSERFSEAVSNVGERHVDQSYLSCIYAYELEHNIALHVIEHARPLFILELVVAFRLEFERWLVSIYTYVSSIEGNSPSASTRLPSLPMLFGSIVTFVCMSCVSSLLATSHCEKKVLTNTSMTPLSSENREKCECQLKLSLFRGKRISSRFHQVVSVGLASQRQVETLP